mmetsp:Transcript_13310/g.15253  ORF Transcript_13310/g.15253 Transcript_13310/m.15253 type:complete len:126 (+) Transcript_13310:104-481(+)
MSSLPNYHKATTTIAFQHFPTYIRRNRLSSSSNEFPSSSSPSSVIGKPCPFSSSSSMIMNLPSSSTTKLSAAISNDDVQLAGALVLPLLAYKISSVFYGQKLQWYLDAVIIFALLNFLYYLKSAI